MFPLIRYKNGDTKTKPCQKFQVLRVEILEVWAALFQGNDDFNCGFCHQPLGG